MTWLDPTDATFRAFVLAVVCATIGMLAQARSRR